MMSQRLRRSFISLRAGLNSPILLKMVFDGKRNLSNRSIEKFIKGINLKEKEAVYFSNLVRFNQAKTALEKQEHYRVLRSMAKMVPQYLIEDEHFDYFDKWYYSAVREGICHYKYHDDWELVATRVQPSITAQEAREAVAWLLDHGLLRKLKNGRYEQIQKAITTRSEVKSMAVRNFNRDHRRGRYGDCVGWRLEIHSETPAQYRAFRRRCCRRHLQFPAACTINKG
jgi:uncharacterized protein (TIGR02147 family)